MLLSTIAFTVQYEETMQSHSQTLVITQNDMMVIDFYTETYGPLVVNVTNRVFFQAWATEERADVFEFANATLKAEVFNSTEVKSLSSNPISTKHRGKAGFQFVMEANFKRIYLEIPLNANTVITRDLAIKGYDYLYASDAPYIYNENQEVTFTVYNSGREVYSNGTVTLFI